MRGAQHRGAELPRAAHLQVLDTKSYKQSNK
jgi:hypothetical protein